MLRKLGFPYKGRVKVLEIAVGAVSVPTRFSSVSIFIRDLVAEILTQEFWGLGWGVQSDPQESKMHLGLFCLRLSELFAIGPVQFR